MQDKTRESSEVFADFTISRIPHKTLSSLSVEQLNDVRSALVAQSTETRHSLDIRIRLPLFLEPTISFCLQVVIEDVKHTI